MSRNAQVRADHVLRQPIRRCGTPTVGSGVDAGLPRCFSIDRAGRITGWTSAAERLVGWPAARANGRRADDLLIVTSSLVSYHAELAVLENAAAAEGWLRVYVNHRDGRQVPVALALTRVAGGDGTELHVSMRPSTGADEPASAYSLLHAVLGGLEGVDGAVLCDGSGHLVVMTGVLEEIFGPAEGRAEDGSWSLRHADGRPMLRHELPLVRALRGETVRDTPFVVDLTGGSRGTFLATGRALTGVAGRRLGALMTIRECGG